MRIAATCTHLYNLESNETRWKSWTRTIYIYIYTQKEGEGEKGSHWPDVLAKFHAERAVFMMTSSFLRARVFQRAPRLSCIKSAIESLVHREFHGHKRPACAVSHNLRVVAKRGPGGRKRTRNSGGFDRKEKRRVWENVKEREREEERDRERWMEEGRQVDRQVDRLPSVDWKFH